MPNELATSTSPYLRAHADNPVDWRMWTKDALAEAARRDVPLLISIGYSTCHWCHVMAHESFEDEALAALPLPDLLATLVELTAVTIARAVAPLGARRVVASGGGDRKSVV